MRQQVRSVQCICVYPVGKKPGRGVVLSGGKVDSGLLSRVMDLMAACPNIYPCQLYRPNDNVGYLIGSQHVEQLDVFRMTGPSSSRYSPFVERETQIRIVRSVLPSPICSTAYGPANPQSTCTSTSYRERRVHCFLVHVGEETVRSLMPADPTPVPERRARQEFPDD